MRINKCVFSHQHEITLSIGRQCNFGRHTAVADPRYYRHQTIITIGFQWYWLRWPSSATIAMIVIWLNFTFMVVSRYQSSVKPSYPFILALEQLYFSVSLTLLFITLYNFLINPLIYRVYTIHIDYILYKMTYTYMYTIFHAAIFISSLLL